MTTAETNTQETTGFRAFTLLWLGQLVSTVGSGLTGFVLGAWVYMETGSATLYALIAASSSIPGILALPFAGVVADRFDRRKVMLAADFFSALCTLGLWLLFSAGRLEVWHIWLMTALSSTSSAFQLPAYSAAVPSLVSRERLGRVNGMIQTAQALGVIAPGIAGALVGWIGVGGVIAIDLGTFVFAAATLLVVRIPRPAPAAAAQPKGSLFRDAAYGWTYLRERPALLWLVMLFAVYNFALGMASVLIMPLILSFTSLTIAGYLYAAGGSGMVVGGLAMSAWGGPKRKISGVLTFMALAGTVLFAHALAPSVALIAVVAPLFLGMMPVINGSTATVIQTRVPGEVLGRVFATVSMLARMSAPVAYFVAGPLADRVFEPALAPGGSLSGSLGSVIGVGDGRGIAAMFMVSGLVLVGSAVAGALSPRLRALDEPEPEAAPAPAAPGAVPAGA